MKAYESGLLQTHVSGYYLRWGVSGPGLYEKKYSMMCQNLCRSWSTEWRQIRNFFQKVIGAKKQPKHEGWSMKTYENM